VEPSALDCCLSFLLPMKANDDILFIYGPVISPGMVGSARIDRLLPIELEDNLLALVPSWACRSLDG
jgi:hypothetical protein